MGEHKRSVCRSGLHALEGHNQILHDDGTRECRACRNTRTARNKRQKRKDINERYGGTKLMRYRARLFGVNLDRPVQYFGQRLAEVEQWADKTLRLYGFEFPAAYVVIYEAGEKELQRVNVPEPEPPKPLQRG